MTKLANNLGTIVLLLGAVLVIILIVHRELVQGDRTDRADLQEIREVEDWTALAKEGHLSGSSDNLVTVIEFADFQCPFCAQIRQDLARITRPQEVSLVYRHFPLDIFEHSFRAALASECAAEQDRFQQYHDVLFANQEEIGTATWLDFAEQAGVPVLNAFEECLEEEQFRKDVEADLEAAANIGVRSTPTVVVNGRVFSGASSMEAVAEHVKEEIKRPR